MGKIRFISLFAGIGGFDLGLERAGMECVAQVEIDPFCQKVLAKHWPNVERFSDVRECGKHNLPPADLICGGFPCQPHSVAGKRRGAGDDHDLWPEYRRIVAECRPRWVIGENVRGILSNSKGQFFEGILRDLAEIGYDAEWEVISACAFGAPHTRERVFVIAYPAGCRRERVLRQTVLQASHDLPPETLGTWNGSGNPFENIEKLLGTPGACMLPDGVSSTMAVRPALRGYGNAVVPQVVEWIGRMIIEADK